MAKGPTKIVTTEDRNKARQSMSKLFSGLCRRFKDPEDYLSDEIVEMIQEINKTVLPKVKFERNWDDHINMIEAIVEANNEETLLFKASYKRLGNLGIVLVTEMTKEAEKAHLEESKSAYHPFAILLAANIKHQFRDLSVMVKPTLWKRRISETEIIMQ